MRARDDPGRRRRCSIARAAATRHSRLRALVAILVTLAVGSSAATASASGLVFFGQFDGSNVTGESLNAPWGVTVDSATGNVFVADITGHVKTFTAAGGFLADVLGTSTTGAGYSSTSVVVNPDNGDIYVTDESHALLHRYSSAGAPLGQVSTGFGPFSLARNPVSGDVYVAEESAGAVERFSASLAPLSVITSLGGQARGVAVDPSTGNVWVGTGTAGKVVTLDANLTFLSSFDASPGVGPDTTGIGVDPGTGHVYAVDSNYTVLRVYTYGGTLVSQLGGPGPGAGGGMFSLPFGVTVDPGTGAVYVADAGCAQSEDSRCPAAGTGRVEIFGAPPTISGSPLDGSTLYATRPTQVGRGPFTYSYQWLECPVGDGACTNHGAPSANNGLRLTPADENKVFEVAVTTTSPLGAIGPLTSARVGPVAASPPVDVVAPAIIGTPADGTVLNATHGTWSGAPVTSYTYQWQSCAAGTCATVGGNASAYRLVPSDVGHTIQLQVSATNPDAAAGPVASTAFGPVTLSPPVIQVAPSLTGTPAPGNRVQGHAGTWSGVLPISYAYQWQRCPDGTPASCVDIPGATVNSYRLIAADTHVRLVVTATNADGHDTAASLIAP